MSFIRFSGAVNKVRAGNPAECLEEVKQVLAALPDSDIAVFPALALSGVCGSLAEYPALALQSEGAFDKLAEITAERPGYVIAGVLAQERGRGVPAIAVLHEGSLVAYIAEPTLEKAIPDTSVFACGNLRFCVLPCALSSLTLKAADLNCDLVIIPACEPMYAGRFGEICRSASQLSKEAKCAVAVVNGGVGETSSPTVYNGFIAVYECGVELAAAKAKNESFSCTVDFDLELLHAAAKTPESPVYAIPASAPRKDLLREIDANPFLPRENLAEYLSELFALQTRALAARMENIGVSRLVLGVSGGLDSTAALLCCAAAVDSLGLPRANITAVTMPGFGTGDATYYNALSLIQHLGATCRDISIRRSVSQHFEDIGHGGKKDVVYENAQARERAQILLDIANAVGGIAVGTGDISEAALGFATFAGDHIANYNVNASITKTALRALVRHVAEAGLIANADKTLFDLIVSVLETPISPELLPPEEGGGFGQKTEDILAPYELLDFFLYYFLKYRFSPAKLLLYTCAAFSGKYEPAYIKEKLKMFIERFCAAQFKRACSPDGAALTEVNFTNAGFFMPSDFDPSGLLAELE